MWRVARVAAGYTSVGVGASSTAFAQECCRQMRADCGRDERSEWGPAAARLAAVLGHMSLPVASAQAATTKFTGTSTDTPSRPAAKAQYRPPNFYPWDSNWDGREGAGGGKGTRRLVSTRHTCTPDTLLDHPVVMVAV